MNKHQNYHLNNSWVAALRDDETDLSNKSDLSYQQDNEVLESISSFDHFEYNSEISSFDNASNVLDVSLDSNSFVDESSSQPSFSTSSSEQSNEDEYEEDEDVEADAEEDLFQCSTLLDLVSDNELNEDIGELNVPLYEGSQRTLLQLVFDVLSFQIHRKSSQMQVKHLLSSVDKFSPNESNLTPKSYYLFKKLVLRYTFKVCFFLDNNIMTYLAHSIVCQNTYMCEVRIHFTIV